MSVVLGTTAGFVRLAPSTDPVGLSLGQDTAARALKHISPVASARITEIGWYCSGATPEVNFEVGLYVHDVGSDIPGELLYSNTVNAKGTDEGWKTVVVDWVISELTTYWIAVYLDNTTPNTSIDYASSGGRVSIDVFPGALLDPWVNEGITSYILALYALVSGSAPEITDQSTSSTILVDDAVVLSVTATGDPAPTYQWEKDGNPLAGETAATLSFTADNDSGGVYNCTATNGIGSDTTTDITLSMIPIITSQSSDTASALGQSVTLTVTAAGFPTVTYQWYKDDVSLSGETSASITFFSTQLLTGTYKCTITNAAGFVDSADIEVTVVSNIFRYNAFNLNLNQDRAT